MHLFTDYLELYCVWVEEHNRLTVKQVYLSIYQPTYSQTSLPIHLSTDLQSNKSTYPFINRLTVKQVYLSIYQPTYSQASLPIYLSIDLQSSKSTYPFINRLTVKQVYLSIYQTTYSQTSLPIYLSTDLQSIKFTYLFINRLTVNQSTSPSYSFTKVYSIERQTILMNYSCLHRFYFYDKKWSQTHC